MSDWDAAPLVCGTVRGYLAHLHRGTSPCGLCSLAWSLFSGSTPAGGDHRRVITVPGTAATKHCAGCRQDLTCHDWSDRQWVKPDGRCTHCVQLAGAARAREALASARAAVA